MKPHRTSRVARIAGTFGHDLGHAARQMIRHPFASGLTLATLVVGVSATAVVYSVVHAVVLSPLPFAEPDRLVYVTQLSPQGREYSTSEPNFVDFRLRSRSFTEMAAMGWTSPILTGEGDPESVSGRRVLGQRRRRQRGLRGGGSIPETASTPPRSRRTL